MTLVMGAGLETRPRWPALIRVMVDWARMNRMKLERDLLLLPLSGTDRSEPLDALRRDYTPPLLAYLTNRDESGGLSSRPLLAGMLEAVRRARELAPSLPILASGGIFTAADAAATLSAGADLVQLWTGLVYRGPGLIGDVVHRVP